MKFFKFFLPLFIGMAGSFLYGQIETDTEDIRTEPFEELEELERRELAEAHEGEIAITADVRLKWIPQSKKTYTYWTRGSGSQNPVSVPTAAVQTNAGDAILAPTNFYQVEANVYLDFDQVKDWVEVQLQFRNTMGIISNTSNNISLRKAWIGYSFWKSKCSEFYVELGRKGLSSIFESRIQFDATFDGILFTFENESCLGKLKIDAGPCIVDYNVDHYAYIGEIDLEDILGTNFWAKYALAWWRKPDGVDQNGVHDSPQFRFVNSQWLAGYDIDKKYIIWPGTIYAAFEINHAAKKVVTSNYTKQNIGWYAGFEYGKIGSAGDVLLDLCYQDVGYQAVPTYDMSGIGRGNSTSRRDLPVIADPTNSGNFATASNVLVLPAAQAEGVTNFRGFEFRCWWTIVKHLTLRETADFSWHKYKPIGGFNRFYKFELNLIYDF